MADDRLVICPTRRVIWRLRSKQYLRTSLFDLMLGATVSFKNWSVSRSLEASSSASGETNSSFGLYKRSSAWRVVMHTRTEKQGYFGWKSWLRWNGGHVLGSGGLVV